MGNEYIYLVVNEIPYEGSYTESVWVNEQRAKDHAQGLNKEQVVDTWEVQTFILNEPDGEL